jgi:hypothetical protein
MKNKHFTLLLISFTLTGCSFFYPFTTVVDEFKNTRKTTLDINTFPAEYPTNNVVNTSISFEKCISNSGETLTAYFILNRNSSSFKLDNGCFIKASGKIFETSIEDGNTEYKSRQEAKTESTSVKEDSIKVKTESKTYLNTYNWYEEKFKIRFTPEMIESIKKTDELIFRFYLGPKQASYKFTGYSLQKIKKLLEI